MIYGNEESTEIKLTTPWVLDQFSPSPGVSKNITLLCPELLSGSETSELAASVSLY